MFTHVVPLLTPLSPPVLFFFVNFIFYVFIYGCTGSSLQHSNSQLQHVGSSSPTRKWPGPPAVRLQSLNHWTTRQVPLHLCFKTLCFSSTCIQRKLPLSRLFSSSWMSGSIPRVFKHVRVFYYKQTRQPSPVALWKTNNVFQVSIYNGHFPSSLFLLLESTFNTLCSLKYCSLAFRIPHSADFVPVSSTTSFTSFLLPLLALPG